MNIAAEIPELSVGRDGQRTLHAQIARTNFAKNTACAKHAQKLLRAIPIGSGVVVWETPTNLGRLARRRTRFESDRHQQPQYLFCQNLTSLLRASSVLHSFVVSGTALR